MGDGRPVLVDVATRGLTGQQAMLDAARATLLGGEFVHAGISYRRTTYRTYQKHPSSLRPEVVLVENLETGEQTDLFAAEDDAFWAWAIIETLRHTGIRHEELLEITHLALVSYRLADTGELVPLLQILPSKNNQERLLLVGPELASVLATIITRLRDRNGSTVPLVSRYDEHERTFTPHDFRRMFATEAVIGGLPVHIAARLLGHEDLSTTQAYLAVFQDDLIRTYRAFLDQRRG